MFEIMAVEDEPAMLNLMRTILTNTGEVEFHGVENGAEALNQLQGSDHHQPDLIISNWNLPGLHGRDLLAAVKSDPRLADIPVLVVSSSEEAVDCQEAHRLGALCFVTKPDNYESYEEVLLAAMRF